MKFLRKAALVMGVLMILSGYARADSMVNYMGNILSSFGNLQPKAYHSQQRGYFVGGSMRIPPLGQTIHPFTVTLPSWSNDSCGGINVMMGGFSFLNFDYLVQKLQAMIQAAPALAFEIALRVLSEQLTGSANTLESIIDALNGLNFNSCTAMNGIVTTAANAITDAIKHTGSEASNRQSSGASDNFASAVSDYFNNVKKAVVDFWNRFKTKVTASGGSGNSSVAKEEAAGIPPGGLLAAVANELGGMPDDFINTMRYYLGDVIGVKTMSDNGTPGEIAVVLYPCGATATARGLVEDINSGHMHSVTLDELAESPGNCVGQVVTTSQSLGKMVADAMRNIYQSLVSGQDLSDQKSINLIEISSIPIYSFLRDAALLSTGYGDILVDQMSKPVAINIASVVTGAFIRKLISTVSHVKERLAIGGTKEARENVDRYINHLISFQNQLADQYLNSLKEANAIYRSFLDRYRMMETAVNEKLNAVNLQQALMFQKAVGY